MERVKEAVNERPGTTAVTPKAPGVPFAVNCGDVAVPEASVNTIGEPPKLALGPVVGAAKLTLMPLNGLPAASCTSARKGAANDRETTVLCGEPLRGLITAGAPPAISKELLMAGACPPDTTRNCLAPMLSIRRSPNVANPALLVNCNVVPDNAPVPIRLRATA